MASLDLAASLRLRFGAGSLCASEIEVLFNQFGIKLSTEQMHSLMGEVALREAGMHNPFCNVSTKHLLG